MAKHATLVEPAPNKVGFAVLIDDACRRLRLLDELGQPDRRALAELCELSPPTLNVAIKRPGRLSTKTLVALELKTGVPVNAWLQSLGLLVPTSVNIEDLTPAERRLLNFARQRGEEWINRTVDWLEATE